MNTDDTKPLPSAEPVVPRQPTLAHRRPLLIAAIGVLALGAAGSFALQPDRVALAQDITPTPIASLQGANLSAAKGEVEEIFGNKFVLKDSSGHTLIETGREGASRKLVTKGETVTVTGRFEDGFFHAAQVTHGDGTRVVLGPLSPPPGPLARAKEGLGLWPQADVAQLTALVEKAGFTDVQVAGRGPRHLDMVAKDKDGHACDLHVDLDGRIEERL